MIVESKEDKKFERVVQKIAANSKLLRTWKLAGGVSAQVTALEIKRPDGQTQKMIVRQHSQADFQQNPQMAAHKFRLLHLLHFEGLPVPMPYYFDQSREIFSTPYLVIEYVEGKPEFQLSSVPDLIPQLATQLSKVHHIDYSHLDLSFLPQQGERYAKMLRERPAKVDESLDEGHIRDVLEATWPFPQPNPPSLLHGDFWPGNILWEDGQIVAVIDWEDATLGDPLADLANSRLEILWAFGIDAMEHFTRHYQSMSTLDFTMLPYWDLCAALRPAGKLSEWGLDADREKTMQERHRWFVSQAREKLAS